MTMQFFNLGENNKSVLINFLQDALAKNNEFEIRFGKFYQSKQTNKTAFESNVDIPFFYSLKKVFDASFEKTVKDTKETVYKNEVNNKYRGNIKVIVDLSDNSETIMLKNTIKKYDVYDYDFRYSVAYEKTQNVNINVNLDNYETIRYKHRISYDLPFGHLDLTIVNQEMPDKTYIQKHEVELEITKDDIDSIINYITLISQIRQNNFYITPNSERRTIINEYKSCTNTVYFVGAQPESLCKDKISNLYKYEYSVTDKADGDRVFLFVNQMGDVYFMDNNLNKIFKTDIKCDKQKGGISILDGEMVRVDNQIYFLAFDIFYFNNTDLRGNNDYLLKRRLEILQNLVKSFSKTKFYSVICKDYYFGNVFSASKKILDSVNEMKCKNDGLIFTPVNEPYPKTKKWSSLLKWKPAELNTIDFFAVKIGSDNNIGKWQLYVQGTLPSKDTFDKGALPDKRQTTQIVLFDIEKLSGTNEQNVVTYQTTFPDNLIDETTNTYYINNTVIEFVWNSNDKKFVPLRTRWDKTNNPKKHGNYSKVACNIWNNIHNPIDKDFLCQFYSSKQKDKSDVYFEKMRRFHNKIKEQLYNKYCKNTNWLLELCSGKGGDMHKWTFNNIKNVHGYDISDRNITECKRRINGLSKQDRASLNYNFYNLDLTKDDSCDIIYKNNPSNFDVICCQFGFHYFFECKNHFDNIMKILDTSLHTDGYFIITFLDDTRINELFEESKRTCSYEQNGEVIYFLERESVRQGTLQDNTKIFGNRLKITLNGDNILGEGSDEWIINYKNLLQSMEVAGFDCIETQLFQDIYDKSIDLSDCEKNISFLNRYCVFKKRKVDIIKLPTQNIIKTKHSKFDFNTIDLHQNNFSIYKIGCLYDIIDCLNCIEYKYYKNTITNKNLNSLETSFSDIKDMFTTKNIQYKPVFIDDLLDITEYQKGISNVYFTYHKHIVEKKTDDIEECLEYNNWYIIMYHNQILFDVGTFTDDVARRQGNIKPAEEIKEELLLEKVISKDEIKDDEIKEEEIKEELLLEKVISKVISKDDEIKEELLLEKVISKDEKLDEELLLEKVISKDEKLDEEIKDDEIIKEYTLLKNNGGKITIKVLKDLLQRLNIKSSGKKEELQDRIENLINA